MDPEKTGSNIPGIEAQITKFWEENNIFEKSLEKTKNASPYTFYDGPPFATGLPHYGHILASTIKDLIPRYQTMRGRFVRRRWGWDCHGLPIENIVEKKLNISGKKQIEEIGIKTFNETCRSVVLQYVEEWGKMVRRMGRWVDFDNSYKTMDRDYMESVWWAFKQVYDQGLAYEGRKVLLYCPRCETPISNFEVAMDNSYKDVSEESVYVKFKLKSDSNIYLLAWTTTPWTLPGNVALAVGKDIDYVKAKIGAETLIVAKTLAEKVLPAGYGIVSEMKGKDLVGLAYEPLFDVPDVAASDRSFKVYAADFVTTEDGTGIVHSAVVYGEDDYQLGLHEGLPVVPLLDEKGHFNDKAPELIRGQYFKKSEKAIKDDLEARGLLLKREAYTHSYPHCWRCGTALYYNAIPAWFINIQKIKPKLLKSNEKQINWFPEHLKHGRYQKSVEAAPDWNISRNRYWGNPIPVWKCEKCEKVRVAGSVKDLDLPTTTFYFVRHGEAEQNVLDIASCYPELKSYDLTAKGMKQAKAAAEKIKSLGADMVFSSDLTRTKHTADIISEAVGKEVVTDPRLREINIGEWNGKPEKELLNAWPPEKWWSTPADGGESHADVQARMLDFANEVVAKYPGKKIVIVSHGDPIWLIKRYFGDETYPDFAEPATVATDLPDLHRPYIDEVILKCDCGGNMRRTPEIFDSWVEAGSMPFAEYHYPFENKKLFESRFPAQFVAEYIAQTRAWFYVMHVISQIVFGKAPFENVVTTGNILAEDGSKMSKSKNNYPDPWLVINKYGVDSLRFYLMNSVVMEADNVDFSEKDVESIHRKVTLILWNVEQYYATYAPAGSAGVKTENEKVKPPHVLDRWILARMKELVNTATDALDGYDTVRATRAIIAFVDDLSTWYLRRSRGREDKWFYPVFRAVLITVAKVIAPFMPHLAEAIYRDLRLANYPESVHLTDWPAKEDLGMDEKKLLEDMRVVREAASIGLAFRKSADIPVRQPLARICLMSEDGKEMDVSPELQEVLLAELNVKTMQHMDPGPGVITSAQGAAAGRFTVCLDTNLTDELKLEGEIRKLERAIQEKRKDMGLKVGEMARLTYFADDASTEAAFKGIDTKKTYIAENKKGTGGASGTFELEKV